MIWTQCGNSTIFLPILREINVDSFIQFAENYQDSETCQFLGYFLPRLISHKKILNFQTVSGLFDDWNFHFGIFMCIVAQRGQFSSIGGRHGSPQKQELYSVKAHKNDFFFVKLFFFSLFQSVMFWKVFGLTQLFFFSWQFLVICSFLMCVILAKL